MRGISGFEYRVTDEIKELFLPYCDEARTDSLGNLILLKKGRKSNKTIMLEAHCDEIGLMVSGIDEYGFIKFVSVGGVDTRILPAAEVIIHARKDIKGIIGAKPPHLQTAKEADNSVKLTDMAIDTGLCVEEVKEIVSVGDSITLSQSVHKLLNNNISLKTMDDRAGIYVLYEVFKRVKNIDADLIMAISVQEEVGMRGAAVAAFGIQPDLAIAIDVCHGVTPDNSKEAFDIGSGTVITIGPNIHPRISDKLFEISKKYDIKTNTEVASGCTGTDAWAIQVAGLGVPVGLVSIPLKYMHTSVEVINEKDISATISLLEHFVKESDDFAEGWLCF